jgi:hypothetical protein
MSEALAGWLTEEKERNRGDAARNPTREEQRGEEPGRRAVEVQDSAAIAHSIEEFVLFAALETDDKGEGARLKV